MASTRFEQKTLGGSAWIRPVQKLQSADNRPVEKKEAYLTALLLVASNLFILVGIYLLGWDAASVLLLYWAESAIIGVFTILKIWKSEGKPEGLSLNGKKVVVETPDDLKNVKHQIIPFFCVHYGGFMAIHLVFISSLLFSTVRLDLGLLVGAWIGIAGLFASHGVSFLMNYIGNKEYKTADAGLLMFTPYPRILLMQFTVILGFQIGAPAVPLVIGKTILDVIGHLWVHGALFPSGKENPKLG